jgi:hypothetical protein
MKLFHWVPSAALAVLLATGCNKKSSEVAKQLSELERKANEATERQRQLEQQIEDQKLAAERDSIERERMQIEEARAELEQQQGDAAAAEAEKLRQREEALANREGKLELLQSTLEDKQSDLQQRDADLSERDRELAGREAVALDDDEADDDETPVGDYGTFHESLSPYGSWFETPDYGYVWQPVVVRDLSWRPYTRGRWVCTNRGWTWISDEPFGWATYHYGRWALCRGYGWIWVPGSEWAPSWVSWRYSGTHIGWAPLPPETLAFRGGRCDSTVDVTFGIGASWFNFVETRYFGSSIHHHCLPYTQNNIYIDQTVNITNIYVHNRRVICGGPRYWDVQRQTDRKPPFYRIEEDRHGRPGRDPFAMRPLVKGDRLRVAAPNMDAAWNDGLKPGKVKGRIEAVKIDRQEELRPEVADRFRQSREENRGKAEQSIARLGGTDNFKVRRMEQLETNRRQVEEQSRQTAKIRDDRQPTRQDQLGKRDIEPKITPPKNDKIQILDNADRDRKQREDLAAQIRQRVETRRNQEQAGKTDNVRPLTPPPPKDDKKPPQDNTDRNRKQPGDVAEQTRQRVETRRDEEQAGRPDKGTRIFPPREENRQNQDNADRIRKQREDLAEQSRQREETRSRQDQAGNQNNGTRITPPKDNNNSMPDDSARIRKQQEEQAERTRQQQEAQQQQREQARQQQMEQARREQARQQQQEESRREQARQQQMEDNRREQARQQQQEESRREQSRQQQQEESRREQARQQQQEESRREQSRQQQQEESRREQSRQQEQQQESQRQERNRQDQQRQEEDRRGRNR